VTYTIGEQRWRGLVEVEFVTKDYMGHPSESELAHAVMESCARGARGAERGPNVPAPQQARVLSVVRAR
jgi:hypothetical protein